MAHINKHHPVAECDLYDLNTELAHKVTLYQVAVVIFYENVHSELL